MTIHKEPDPKICEWWDWLQPCGRLVRMKYNKRFPDWPWDSCERLYSWQAIEFIGGKFRPCYLEPFDA